MTVLCQRVPRVRTAQGVARHVVTVRMASPVMAPLASVSRVVKTVTPGSRVKRHRWAIKVRVTNWLKIQKQLSDCVTV